jgi:energy-coupling factor transporter ATP-binding protein EcfA2
MKKVYTYEEIEHFVNSIRRNVELFKVGVKDHIQNDIILVLGSSGSGKSTVMNMIAGKPLEVFEEAGDWRVDVVGKSYAGEIAAEGFLPMKIGHNGAAETNLPNYIFAAENQFWYCPVVVGHTRGCVVDISNAYYVHHILTTVGQSFAYAKGVKFVIVQSSSGTREEGGRSFRYSIESICKMFPSQSVENLLKASTFVFTKVASKESKGNKYLSNVLERVTVKSDLDNERVVNLLEEMKHDLAIIRHVEILKVGRPVAAPAGGSTSDILILPASIIENISQSCLPIKDRDVGFVISDMSHLTLLEISSSIRYIISNTMISIVNKLIKERVEVCYDLAHYQKQITDEKFTPLKLNLKSVVSEKEGISQKLSNLLDIFVKFSIVDLCKASTAQLDDDVWFVVKNMNESIKLADAQEFLSIALPDDHTNYAFVDDLCLSLVGEIDSCSTRASSVFDAEHFAALPSSSCSIV